MKHQIKTQSDELPDSNMTASAFTCFSPARTSSERRPQPPPAGFLATLMASLNYLTAKLRLDKAMKTMVHRRNNGAVERMGRQERSDEDVWRRAILMGDKCQPLDFSGVIYYDESGKQIAELPPRSPRSPLPMSPTPSYLHAR